MGRIGDEDACALVISAIFVILMNDQGAYQFAMCSCGRLKRNGSKTSDLFQHFLEGIHQIQVTLDRIFWLTGVRRSETWQSADGFIDLWVVLHGAGTEWIKSQINGVILL